MTAQPALLLQKTPNQPFIKSMESTLGFGTQQLFQQSCSFNTFHDHRRWQFCTICQHWQQDCNTFLFSPHSLKFLGWWILCPARQQSSGMNCLTCSSHLAQHKDLYTIQSHAAEIHWNQKLLGKKPPTITMCYSYVHHPFLAWNSYQRMFCDIPWVFSVIISYVLRFCLFERVKTLCFTMVLCFGTFQRLPWKNQHIKNIHFHCFPLHTLASLMLYILLPLHCFLVCFFQCRWHHKELKICIRTSLFIFGAHPPALVLSTPSWCVILQMT